ncbi:MAG: hypothetical protein FWF46_01845 [Oscillospiraceae bacterium]|nr:hypothetical protein [Oscillospiraceae bacterium]
MKLYKPVGLFEMEKILESDGNGFPDRLPEQPIFYPVVNYSYAIQIAEKWNKDNYNSGFSGYVTEFNIADEYIKNYEIHCVGDKNCKEYWIPSNQLAVFNQNITDKIKIIEAFYGEQYNGIKPSGLSSFKEEKINNQFNLLKNTLSYNPFDFSCTVFVEWELINLNLLYWSKNIDKSDNVVKEMSKCLERNNKLFVNNKTS